jgi:hypothetical protein
VNLRILLSYFFQRSKNHKFKSVGLEEEATTMEDHPQDNCNGEDGRRPRLGDALLSHIFSFCDPATLLLLLNASPVAFTTAIQWSVSSAPSLCLSFLAESKPFPTRNNTTISINESMTVHSSSVDTERNARLRYKITSSSTPTPTPVPPPQQLPHHFHHHHPHVQRQIQEASTSRLLELVQGDRHHLNHLDFTNLRYLTGHGWMHHLQRFSRNLVSLDFSGCANLDPHLFRTMILAGSSKCDESPATSSTSTASNHGGGEQHPLSAPTATASTTTTTTTGPHFFLHSLKHLSLQGCHRIDSAAILAVASTLGQLHSLLLSDCSQMIRDPCINEILNHLRQLRYLDLSGLKHITDQNGTFFERLPSLLVSLKLSRCEKLRLVGLEHQNWITFNVAVRHLLEGRARQQLGEDTSSTSDVDDDDEDHNNFVSSSSSRRPMQHQPPSQQQQQQQQLQHQPNDPDPHNHQQQHRPPLTRHANLIKIDFDCMGTPKCGLVPGALAYFAVGGFLREVNLSGCEQVRDWEVDVLAVASAHSLTTLELRACTLGNSAVQALARNCKNLAELDVSGCFHIDDDGIVALGRNSRGTLPPDLPAIAARKGKGGGRHPHHRGRGLRYSLKVLKIASLPLLTDDAIRSLTGLESLHLLDVNDCQNVTSTALVETVLALPQLIEVDGRRICEDSGSFTSILRRRSQQDKSSTIMQRLHFVNNRVYQWKTATRKRKAASYDDEASLSLSPQPPPPVAVQKRVEHETRQEHHQGCCTIRSHSQRRQPAQSVPLQPMIHCIDCQLLPQLDRGMCATCAMTCHKGHRTFLGAYTRFYCDCAYGTSAKRVCQAVFPAVAAAASTCETTTNNPVALAATL